MGKRTCGCGERGRHKPDCKLRTVSTIQKDTNTVLIETDVDEDTIDYLVRKPAFAWSFNKTKQSTVEKRIMKLVNKKNPFYLTVTKPDDTIEEWFIDGGNWTSTKHPDGKYHGVLGHINNLLPFIKGRSSSLVDFVEQTVSRRRKRK